MTDNPAPNPVQYMQCAALIAKVMISEDGKFTQSEIELANELLAHSWNNNVTDFLHVVAGIAHSSLDVYSESLAALTFQFDRQKHRFRVGGLSGRAGFVDRGPCQAMSASPSACQNNSFCLFDQAG